MMKTFYLNFTMRFTLLVISSLFLCNIHLASAQTINEGFDNIATLAPAGWNMQNLSNPLGLTNWFQGNPAAVVAYDGATNAYIAANFNNTTGGTGTISNWLITPNRTLNNGVICKSETMPRLNPLCFCD